MNRVFSHARYFIALIIGIIVLVFALPANHITRSLYDISGPQYHFLYLLVDIPLIIAWSVGMYGFTKLSEYTLSIEGSPEARDFRQFSRGMGWFAWGLPGVSFISMSLNAIGNSHPGFVPVAIIIVNYLYIVISVIALNYFSMGAHELMLRNNIRLTNRSIKSLILLFVILGVFFGYIVSTKLQYGGIGDAVNVYYLPNWLVGLSVAVPYLFAWFTGLLAAFELALIARHTSGILYKRALQLLASGLVMIIIAASGLQYFRSIIPRTGHLVIGVALICTYAIYLVYTVGSILLIFGGRRLKKIEDA